MKEARRGNNHKMFSTELRIRLVWSETDPGALVGFGSGCFGLILIQVFESDPAQVFWSDPDIWVVSGSRYLDCIRIRVFWSDPDQVILF